MSLKKIYKNFQKFENIKKNTESVKKCLQIFVKLKVNLL